MREERRKEHTCLTILSCVSRKLYRFQSHIREWPHLCIFVALNCPSLNVGCGGVGGSVGLPETEPG